MSSLLDHFEQELPVVKITPREVFSPALQKTNRDEIVAQLFGKMAYEKSKELLREHTFNSGDTLQLNLELRVP